MIFPRNNLPTESRYWAREVEKKVTNLESSFKSAEVNNVTRDSQLIVTATNALTAATDAQQAATQAQVAADAANQAIIDAAAAQADADAAQDTAIAANGIASAAALEAAAAAQEAGDAALAASTANGLAIDALNGLGSLDEATSTYKINASNVTVGSLSGDRISGGQITGVILNTATSGPRIEMNRNDMLFYDDDGNFSGRIDAENAGRAATLYVGSNVSGVFMYNGGMDLEANGQVKVTGGNGFYSAGPISTDSNLTVTGTLSAGSFSPSSLSTGSITATSLNIGTSEVGTNYIYAQSVTGDSVGGGNASFTGSVEGQSSVVSGGTLTRTLLAGGGTTGASITDGGNFVRTSSSRRYKTDIQLLDIDLNDLYAVEPKTFKRIEEVEEHGEAANVYPGFIAEELAGTSLDKFVFYGKDEEGNSRPEGIHYPELTAALLVAIKDLNSRIESLESR